MRLSCESIGLLDVLCRDDIIVGGGGPAGVAAALAAARCGKQVILVEQLGSLGGMATAGLVPTMMTLSDGVHEVASGICVEIVSEVCARMGLDRVLPHGQPIDSEIFKQVCDEKISEAGVRVFFSQKIAATALQKDKITNIVVAGPQGLKRIEGRVFIDATGDAAITAFAGGDFAIGDREGKTMSPTLCAKYAGVDWDRYYNAEAHGNCARVIWKKISDLGEAPLEERHFVGAWKTGSSLATGNLGHIYHINTMREDELSKAYTDGRLIARHIHCFYRDHVPGFEHSELVETASLLGIRESRRIKGDYVLCYDDYLKRRTFEDDIARYSYPIDIHASSAESAEQDAVEQRIEETRYSLGENYGIPYRSLRPTCSRNLLVAGRSISCDREMQSSLRVMPCCFLTGQAAGAAAALSLSCDDDTRKVDIVELRRLLKERFSAYLP